MAIQTTLCLVMQFLNVFQRFCVVRHAKTAFFFAKKGLPQTILLICDSPLLHIIYMITYSVAARIAANAVDKKLTALLLIIENPEYLSV